MSKKTNAKPEKKPAKGSKSQKPAKGKKDGTSPAEKSKTKRGADAAREESVEREAMPPTPPPAPAPTPAAASTATVVIDDPSRNIDGKSLHEKGKYLLNVCPKAKESPALSCISLKGQVAAATDERSCFWVDFGCTVTAAPIKVTRSSFDAFMALLDGELKAAEKLDASVVVRWDGLVATIRREGEPDGRVVLLDRFESGPEADFFFLDAPEFAAGSHATLSIERLRTAATWKGDGDAHVFVSPTARQIWIQFDVAGFTFARAVVAFDGSGLGVRQPTLPMDVSGAKAPVPEKPATEPQVVEAEVIQPGQIRGLPAGLAWVRVECDRGAAWERLNRNALEVLSPFEVDGDIVQWGPWPRDAARVRFVVIYLRSQSIEARVVPCEPSTLFARALAAATTVPSLQLGDGILDAEFEAGPVAELGAGGSVSAALAAFPSPGVATAIEIPLSIYDVAFTDEQRERLLLLERPSGRVSWRVEEEHIYSRTLDAEEARTLAGLLAGWGYRAAEVRTESYGDDSVTVWTVGVVGEVDGAA